MPTIGILFSAWQATTQAAQPVQFEGQVARDIALYMQQVAGIARQQQGFDLYLSGPSDVEARRISWLNFLDWSALTSDTLEPVGYEPNFGLTHRRRLWLSADGTDLRGEDTLSGAHAGLFTVRFHQHPDMQVSLIQNGGAALLRAPSGTA